MTVQAKKFIAPGDVAAMRIDCTRCGASLSIPISGSIRIDRLYGCPNCNEPWLKLPSGASLDLEVRNCVAALNELAQRLKHKEYGGFNLHLEVRDETQALTVEK
jgi:DNA-directed RNA polymerase subunit RPC12/RpoP